MKTKIIKINESLIFNEDLRELNILKSAAQIIKNGGLVIFPTETVYGLGANALDLNAVNKIYAAKGRPSDNPLIVHFANVNQIYDYAEVPEIAQKIIDKFLPAPLTLVLKKKDERLNAACKLETVAVRVPANIIARKFIELAEVPIAAPSANISGKPSPTCAEHIIEDLNGKVDMIICGDNSRIGLESTVVGFDNINNDINILRAGYITREDLANCVDVLGATIGRPPNQNNNTAPIAPGMKYTHYAPNAPLYILNGEDYKVIDFVLKESKDKIKRVGFLCWNKMCSSGVFPTENNIKIISLGSRNNLKEQARNLFNCLNKFNDLNVDIIYSVMPEKTGIGEAIYNRLIKAAGGKIINL